MSEKKTSSVSNTDSEAFIGAMPALARAVDADPSRKTILMMLVQYWCTFTDERKPLRASESAVTALIDASIKIAQNNRERDSLFHILERKATIFAPAEYLSGSD
jgi:hypothetical protein